MSRRIAIMAGVAAWLVSPLVVPDVARSESLIYRLTFTPKASSAAPPLVMPCAERTRCRGWLEVRADGRPLLVTVTVVLDGSVSRVSFATKTAPLFVGGQPFAPIPSGVSRRFHMTLALSEPTPEALEDAGSLLHSPVLRQLARGIATLDLEIEPLE